MCIQNTIFVIYILFSINTCAFGPGLITLLHCGVVFLRRCSLGILTLETLTVYDVGSGSELSLVQGQFSVGAGNAYKQQQSVLKQAAYFGLHDLAIKILPLIRVD